MTHRRVETGAIAHQAATPYDDDMMRYTGFAVLVMMGLSSGCSHSQLAAQCGHEATDGKTMEKDCRAPASLQAQGQVPSADDRYDRMGQRGKFGR
jgi:hypothetical protein